MTKVLLVDDNSDLLILQSALLTQFGHKVQMVVDGNSALEACRTFQPDIVFLDVITPLMDGLAVGRLIRELNGNPRPRIIAITGYAPVNKWEVGEVFDAILPKPFSIEQMNDMIGGWGVGPR